MVPDSRAIPEDPTGWGSPSDGPFIFMAIVRVKVRRPVWPEDEG
jgi:hypothetical protein